MHKIIAVVAGLVLTLGAASSWGQVPSTNDTSDANGNTGGGTNALESLTTGKGNTAYGAGAIQSNSTGRDNAAFGAEALQLLTNGTGNTAVGEDALINQTSGSNNIAVGHGAGSNLTSGDKNIYLGSLGGAASEAATIRVGQNQTRAFVAGIFGTLVNGSPVAVNSKGQLGVATVSSARYKRDIQAMRDRSQGLFRLRPVTFRYKQDSQGVRQYGLIAEEVVKVYPELVTKGADGKVESVQYNELIPMLLNEVQHQQQELTELKAQNERLQAALLQQQEREAEQRAQNAALAARLERLEQGGTREAALVGR